MYIVVNISPGSEMSFLMENLTSRMLTFSVTDDLSKLCGKCSRDCQPLPVPHQIPEPSPPAPPKDTSPCSNNLTPSINFSSKRFRPAPLLTSRGQKDIESRKRLSTYDDDVSEPNPNESSKNSLEAQISQLSQASSHQTEFPADSIFRTIKDEPGTSTSPVSEATAAGLVSDLFKKFEEIVENQQTDEVANLRSTKDMFRGECRLCQLPISIRTHHMRRHAMKHLGFKTYICQLCQKDFNRSDLCKSHFERYHPGKAMIPFHDTITSEQTEKLDQMIQICFPDEYRARHST